MYLDREPIQRRSKEPQNITLSLYNNSTIGIICSIENEGNLDKTPGLFSCPARDRDIVTYRTNCHDNLSDTWQIVMVSRLIKHLLKTVSVVVTLVLTSSGTWHGYCLYNLFEQNHGLNLNKIFQKGDEQLHLNGIINFFMGCL